jgi:arylsulfatase A-like enzyme
MSNVTRREFIAGVGAITAAAVNSNAHSPVKAGDRPNILFILADDLGWGDLSCYGRPDYRTPNIDRLAKEGLRFTNAYSAAPMCTPTRVGFHTGRYPARLLLGLEEPLPARKVLGDRVKHLGIPQEHPTVSSVIKGSGYDTALIGKWHAGYLPHFGPIKSGYDEFFGITSGAGDRFTHKDPAGDPDLFEGEVPVERIGYLTKLLTDRAVEYIKRPHKNPFYLSLHHTSPHWPWQGPNDIAMSGKLAPGHVGFAAGGSQKVYADMMKDLDDSIGMVLLALRTAGLEKKTIVILTSDNGGERFSYNWPFTGQKFDLREGGIRVPAIVRWPGVTRPGTVSDRPVITMDWTATMLSAAGTKPDPGYPLDGVDLTSELLGRVPSADRSFFWRTKRQGAMRAGRWKYLREGTNEFLFDLSVDEREQAEFGSAQPGVLDRMRQDYDKWESQMLRYPAPPA